jgi:hypothetical protein
MSLALPLIAILVSITSFAVNYWHTRQTDITSRKPVLVFEYREDQGWVLRNVGMGPAMNILVAIAPGGPMRTCTEEKASGWVRPVRVPPLPSDGVFGLHWAAHIAKSSLGATYTDYDGRPYTSTCRNDLTQTCKGRQMPEWAEVDIQRHWNAQPAP